MDWKKLLCNERPRQTSTPGDHRIEFERDFDRSIFSTPVKRLQDKAQVFPLEPIDAIRTRLTHSLEVSSVARGLAARICKWLIQQNHIDKDMDRSIEAIAATCGLIHDLGNPPFGHSGEDAIREWFVSHKENLIESGLNKQCMQDFLNFEGNAQSLRLVSKLQLLADYHGLNLTFGTLSASCKYIAPSNGISKKNDHTKSKPGYFASENALVKEIRERTGTGDARNPITFIVEAADDIVYSVADIEDAVKKGVIDWMTVKNFLIKNNDENIANSFERMEKILMAGGDTVRPDLSDDIYASAFRTAAIGIMVVSVANEFESKYSSIMSGEYKNEIVTTCSAKVLVQQLKELGMTKVYGTSSNLKLELMGRKVIKDLMDIFWEGAKLLPKDKEPKSKHFAGKAGLLLSKNYREVFQHFVKTAPELPEDYHRYQLVTDYVCGMTDTFAKRLHAELTNG